MAQDHFHKGEKVCLRWRGLRRLTKALNRFELEVKDLQNYHLQLIRITTLIYYHHASVDEKTIFYHVLSFETGMPAARLKNMAEQDVTLFVDVHWKAILPMMTQWSLCNMSTWTYYNSSLRSSDKETHLKISSTKPEPSPASSRGCVTNLQASWHDPHSALVKLVHNPY